MSKRTQWAKGEWLPRGAKRPRPEWRWGNWLVSEGHNHEERDQGRPWALVGPGHVSYHRRSWEARQALPKALEASS